MYNGDDSLSLKGNSTDISIKDSFFSGGLGIAIGSIGQYNGEYEVIQGLTVDNITYDTTLHAVRFKRLSTHANEVYRVLIPNRIPVLLQDLDRYPNGLPTEWGWWRHRR